MNDLNVINRLNAEAVARDIPNAQRNGHYVVAEYLGLHFIGYSLHATQAEANAKACEIGNQPGARSTVFDPILAPAAQELPLDLAV